MEKTTFNKEIQLLEEAIYKFPQVLLNLKTESAIKFVNSYLPYSTGIEIECNELPTYKISEFQNIPDIMEVGSSKNEQRFRIPNGLKGLICLYNICEKLHTNCSLNMGSGIHYHIDMTDAADLVFNNEFIAKHNDYIIGELIKWNTAKKLNSDAACSLDCRGWVNFQSGFKTMEIRIGEMAFDYPTLVKRIIDGNRIAKHIKGFTNKAEKLIDIEKQMKQLFLESKTEIEDLNIHSYKQIINSRIIKV